LNIFLKSVEKIQILLRSENHNTYFTWSPRYYDIISRN